MAKHRQMPEDPTGHHCILTARAGHVQIQVQGWGPCLRCGSGVAGRQQGGRKSWLRMLRPSKKKQAKYCPRVPKGSRRPNRRALWARGNSNVAPWKLQCGPVEAPMWHRGSANEKARILTA